MANEKDIKKNNNSNKNYRDNNNGDNADVGLRTAGNSKYTVDEVLEAMMRKLNMLEDKLQDAEKRASDAEAKAAATSNKKANTSMSLDDEVTIIFNMLGGTLRAEFPTWKLVLTDFGQRYVITRRQFQELLNTKRSF